MRRYLTFTFRVNPDELKMIASLSIYHDRSQSDVIRMLIRQAISEISSASKANLPNHNNAKHSQK